MTPGGELAVYLAMFFAGFVVGAGILGRLVVEGREKNGKTRI